MTPDAEALRFGAESLSFAAFRAAAHRLADVLRSEGVGRGERVAVMVPNGLDMPIAWFAIAKLRAIVVPVNVTYGERDLAHVLSHSGASVVLSGPEQRPGVVATSVSIPKVRSVLELTGGEVAVGAGSTGIGGTQRGEAEGPSATANEPVAIQYTSGTTGFPKGCVLHHGYWIRLARTFRDLAGLDSDDVLLTAQAQTYMDPTWNLVLSILVGGPLVVLPRFSASTFWADVGRSGATFFYCIGTMPLFLLAQPGDEELDRGHRVRLAYCSGIPPLRHEEMERRWGCRWRETYGTTELGVVLATGPADEASVGSGSMGGVVPGRDVMVRQGEAYGNEVGELLVRGPDTMLHYHNDPEATAARQADDWVRTGDLVTESALGYSLVGRAKDMIRRAGENISAAEVEAVLVEHPAVRAAACIPVDDDLRGEEVKAYVQRIDDQAISEAELHAFVAERLAPFKVPRYIEFVGAFPLTQSEKIAKAELKASRPNHTQGSWDALHLPEPTRP